jgi:hypothetical protein
VAVGSVGVFRYATFAVKYWTDFSLKFVQYLHTNFQYLSAAMLQLSIGKPLEINAYDVSQPGHTIAHELGHILLHTRDEDRAEKKAGELLKEPQPTIIASK